MLHEWHILQKDKKRCENPLEFQTVLLKIHQVEELPILSVAAQKWVVRRQIRDYCSYEIQKVSFLINHSNVH